MRGTQDFRVVVCGGFRKKVGGLSDFGDEAVFHCDSGVPFAVGVRVRSDDGEGAVWGVFWSEDGRFDVAEGFADGGFEGFFGGV